MSGYPHLATRLYNAPLLLTPEKAEVIEAVFRAHVERTPLEPVASEQPESHLGVVEMTRAAGGYWLTPSGIGVIQIFGTLVQRASGLDAASGLSGYNRLASQLGAAMADGQVRGILLEVDSPGGEANGVFDLAQQIRAAAASKPVWAVANEQAFSAAYALAAAAQKLYLPETGMVGSVGVMMLHVDQSKRDASQGYAYTPIFAGAHKNDFTPHAPLSDRARGAAQAEVDRLYDIFVDAVANTRGIKAAAVRNTQAGLLNPEQALRVGMADGVATFGEVVERFAAELQPKLGLLYSPRAAADLPTANSIGGFMANEKNAAPASPTPEEQLAAARADGVAEGTRNGVVAERARIAAILDADEAKSREKLARHLALKTDATADAARELLSAAAAEAPATKGALANAMAGVPNPHVGIDPGRAAGEAPIALNVAAIYESRRQAQN